MADPIPFTDDDIYVASKTVFGEARGEPVLGQQAVAWVIRNRASWAPPAWWGSTPMDVCLKPWQFSCFNPTNNPELAVMESLTPGDDRLTDLAQIVQDVFSGAVDDPTKGSTMYQVVGTGARWSKGQLIAAIIGKHEFYALPPT